MSNMVSLEKLKIDFGEDVFNKLVEKHAGKNIYIPKRSNEHLDRNERNRFIVKDYFAGIKIKELMMKYELSKSAIYKIIEKR